MPACKLTPEVEVSILDLVADGNTLVHAARASDIVAETARNWVKWGEAGKKPYADFVKKLRIAEAKAISSSVSAFKRAGEKDWRAAQKFLEYMEKRRSSEASVARHIEEILQAVEDELGKEAAARVMRVIVDRSSETETSEPGATVRLVASR